MIPDNICRICLTPADPEHPETVYGLNPATFRQALMHWWCFLVAYEELAEEDAKRPEFYDRQDEYVHQVQIYPETTCREI